MPDDAAGDGAGASRPIDPPLEGASDHGVSEALYLADPDGNGIELYRDRPREEWPRPEGGEKVHMYTRPLDVEALLAST